MRPVKRILILAATLILAACGRIVPLEPAPGHQLPVKPTSAAKSPTVEDLLALRADAAPRRVDELVSKSQPRRADRFDLPPPDGGAPDLPAAALPSDPTGPAPPK